MKKCIAVFRSRTQAYMLENELNSRGIYARAVPTPKQAKIGCGVSVEFYMPYYTVVSNIVKQKKYSSFYTFLSV